MNCHDCGLPMETSEMGVNFKGEKVEYHGFQAKCVELLREKFDCKVLEVRLLHTAIDKSNEALEEAVKVKEERDRLLLQIDELKAENTRLVKSFNEYGKNVEAENAMLKQLNDDLCERVKELKNQPITEKRVDETPKAKPENDEDDWEMTNLKGYP